MSHHLYEENKRLKRENEDLHMQLRERVSIQNEARIDQLARAALYQILMGTASLMIEDCGDSTCRVIFNMNVPLAPQPE